MNIYVYVHTYMNVTIFNEKKVMNLQESKDG